MTPEKFYVAVWFANEKRGKTGFLLYEVIDNKLRTLWITWTFSRGMTKGVESEAWKALCQNGLAPKELEDKYYYEVGDQGINIQYITPRKQ